MKLHKIMVISSLFVAVGCSETQNEIDTRDFVEKLEEISLSVDSTSIILDSQSIIIEEIKSGLSLFRINTDSIILAETAFYKQSREKEGETTYNNLWAYKLEQLNEIRYFAKAVMNFLVIQASDMIIMSDPNATDLIKEGSIPIVQGEFYYTTPEGYHRLFPLKTILNKDDFNTPTELFVGSDGIHPNKTGREIRKKLIGLKKVLTSYITGDFKFPPAKDLAKIKKLNEILDYPEMVGLYGKLQPWPTATFKKAPVIAVAAQFQSFIKDVLQAENLTINYLVEKEM